MWKSGQRDLLPPRRGVGVDCGVLVVLCQTLVTSDHFGEIVCLGKLSTI